jgi:hypothetical protein
VALTIPELTIEEVASLYTATPWAERGPELRQPFYSLFRKLFPPDGKGPMVEYVAVTWTGKTEIRKAEEFLARIEAALHIAAKEGNPRVKPCSNTRCPHESHT